MTKAKKTTKGKMAAEIAAGLIAAAAAGYYFYGSKRAKKNRKVVANELKSDWKMIRQELQQISRTGASHAKVVGKRAIAGGKKAMKSARRRIVKKVKAKARKSR